MSISGKKRPSSDILQNVHIQIEQETRDGGFTNPPTKRSRLAEDDQSSVRKVGNSENLARMVDMTGFRGLGQTPNINQMALLNPRPGPLDRFKQAGSTRFDDDGPRVSCFCLLLSADVCQKRYLMATKAINRQPCT